MISIHALHEESDPWRAAETVGQEISIHALHEESDRGAAFDGLAAQNFNPRSP